MTPAAKAFVESAIGDLERLKTTAELHGDDLALLAYILDMALVEARSAQGQ
jgi:hypothetical protein